MTDTTWHIPDPQAQPEFYADIPTKRLVAWVVDTLLILALCVVVLPFTAFTGIFFFPLLMLMVGFVYRATTIARGSATLGMRLMAIELRTLSGQRFDLPMAVMHTAIYTGCFVFPLLQLLSCVMMLTTARAQGLGDHMLGTVALNRRAMR